MGLHEMLLQIDRCWNCPFHSKCEKSEDKIKQAGYVNTRLIFGSGLDIKPPFESKPIQSKYFDDRRQF